MHYFFLMSVMIAGARCINITQYPYQVSIQLRQNLMVGKIKCGGSLIKFNVVLTAAHCMQAPLRDYLVRAGSTYFTKGGKVLRIHGYLNHPKYNYESGTGDYDISIIKLKGSFSNIPKVKTIALFPHKKEIPDGTTGTIIGWGRAIQSNKTSYSKILKEAKVMKYNFHKCQKRFAKVHEVRKITNRMTCYRAEKGQEACKGDYGGPLIVKKRQVGIISWSRFCGRDEVPGVYTNLQNKEIRSFIKKQLK